MRILKDGKSPIDPEYKITCRHCGAVMAARKSELRLQQGSYLPSDCDYYFNCLFCKKEGFVYSSFFCQENEYKEG